MNFPTVAQFQHPRLGNYGSPQELLEDGRLSETEKQMAIDAWRRQLDHGAYDTDDAPLIRHAIRSLDAAAERLAAGHH
ncbi:hypothetical protein [Jiella sonneratiae]|uniref:Type II toxin-antitoxin system ParD family antitoxin n=1 Tax=Jiella sonneratiae TaxID=2816856 RepID=A0ABS3J8M3_9HYPH|nr:hypothetical protein [Jiella sonneratiae]MBO0906020.1 hypothetical protein [Jiella sonneratiae]